MPGDRRVRLTPGTAARVRYASARLAPRTPTSVPCLLALVALAAPRLTIAALWFLTNWFRGVFDSALWPILGFLFAPLTLLWYSAVQHWYGGQWGTWQIVGIVVALFMDGVPARLGRGKRR